MGFQQEGNKFNRFGDYYFVLFAGGRGVVVVEIITWNTRQVLKTLCFQLTFNLFKIQYNKTIKKKY